MNDYIDTVVNLLNRFALVVLTYFGFEVQIKKMIVG